MDTRALASGDVLANRYRLEDLISEGNDAFTWRAADQALNRSVCVQAMAASDTRVEAFLEAARRSTTVTDPRFLRILDIVEDERGQTYLVREWARAVSLDRILRQSTLPNRRSATIVSEVAEAMANAHEAGVYHLHLGPNAILIKDSGAVRITGLAVDEALHGEQSGDRPVGYEEQVDIEAIGKVLYVCLAGRWPGNRRNGLKAAPTEHGRLLRPRQVRAGVSRDVDTVCDRILGTPPRHGVQPLRAARDIAHELRLAGDDEALVTDDQPSLIGSSPDLFSSDIDLLAGGPPPAINPPKPKPAVLQPAPPTTFERSRAAALQATSGDRKWIAGGIAILLLVAVAMGIVVGRQSDSPSGSASDEQTAATNKGTPSQPLLIQGVSDYDPESVPPEENPEDVGNAIDNKPATIWETLYYKSRPDLGGLKSGVGLLVDLGKVQTVDSVDVTLQGGPTAVSIYGADPDLNQPPTTSPSDADTEFIGGTTYQRVRGGQSQLLDFEQPVETRWVLVWLTKLPQDTDGTYRGRIAEIKVRGTS
ncbi:protein kinase family protein [Solicola gregarius]|uniref:Protein kinase family protein n=1 Tax=Solicola gregarius TaxID=2908642 RepID=A0AA46TLN0_9ACTN|nr:protein kinase family protein [Solicola gregarius]UYM07355.1 protein kinase family protein [Solicola gregarius]